MGKRLIVLKIGGSFLLKDGVPQVDCLKEMAETVRILLEKDYKVKSYTTQLC